MVMRSEKLTETQLKLALRKHNSSWHYGLLALTI